MLCLYSNKPKDILLLSTRSASDVAKVINYRKKHLALQGQKIYMLCVIYTMEIAYIENSALKNGLLP